MEESTDAAVEGVLGAMENLPIKTAGWTVDLRQALGNGKAV